MVEAGSTTLTWGGYAVILCIDVVDPIHFYNGSCTECIHAILAYLSTGTSTHVYVYMYMYMYMYMYLLPANLLYAGKEVIKCHHFVEVILQKTSKNWCDELFETTTEETDGRYDKR